VRGWGHTVWVREGRSGPASVQQGGARGRCQTDDSSIIVRWTNIDASEEMSFVSAAVKSVGYIMFASNNTQVSATSIR